MRVALIAFTFAFLIASCNSNGNNPNEPSTPVVEPTEPKPSPKMATATIASVQLQEDCPDIAPTPAKSAAKPMAAQEPADSPGPSYAPPCTQSSMQIAFSGQGKTAAAAEIGEIRLQTSDGKTVALLKSRLPSAWEQDGGYRPWDSTIQPRTDIKTSYKLSLPDWTAVERKIGGPSFGPMFHLEVEIRIGDETKTVTSPQFSRQHIEMMPT